MNSFRHKKIESIESVGEILQRHRKSQGLSIEKVARQININVRYLKILEHAKYPDMPAPVYTKNFLREYALFLNLNPETVLNMHEKELEIYERTYQTNTKKQRHYKETILGIFLRPQTLKIAALVIACSIVLLYIGISINSIFAPPELIIKTPHEASIITTDRSILLEGITEKEVGLTINEKPILTDQDGRFTLSLDLQKGLNTIKITAKKKHSNEKTIYRQIIVTDETNNQEQN